MRHRFYSSLFLIAALAASSSAAVAGSIVVDSTDGGPVNVNGNCTLTEATVAARFNAVIDQCAAGVATGTDTITFSPGVFSGPPLNLATINLQQSLALDGNSIVIEAPPSTSLTVSGNGNDPIFQVNMDTNDDLTLRRFTLNNGNNTAAGGAIAINGADNNDILLEDMAIINSHSDALGGAIGADVDGELAITAVRTMFSGNSSGGDGGAIGAGNADGSDLFITVDDCDFQMNTATGDGGGIHIGSATGIISDFVSVTVVDSRFDSNTAVDGGAISLLQFATGEIDLVSVAVDSARFRQNTARDNGGGIYLNGANGASAAAIADVRQASFDQNEGRGALNVRYSDLYLSNSVFSNNTSDFGVAGLFGEYQSLNTTRIIDVYGNTFFENSGDGVHDIDLRLPDSTGGSVTRFVGNLVAGIELSGNEENCLFANTPVATRNNASRTSNSSSCTPGFEAVRENNLGIDLTMISDAIHEVAVIPRLGSPIVDAWAGEFCENYQQLVLATDQLGPRRDMDGPFDGDADMNFDCDIGAIERDAPVFYELTVDLVGNEQGSIDILGPDSSSSATCTSDCVQTLLEGVNADIIPTADPGNTFVAWGGDCSGDSTCNVTMNADRNVTAEFASVANPVTVSVTLNGSGTGTVTSVPAGISCPSSCMATYMEGDNVTLTANPDAGQTFVGWSGACSGQATCELINLMSDATVTAEFEPEADLIFSNGFEQQP